jgi:hypothetical protein
LNCLVAIFMTARLHVDGSIVRTATGFDKRDVENVWFAGRLLTVGQRFRADARHDAPVVTVGQRSEATTR